jgi:hypothetical protein
MDSFKQRTIAYMPSPDVQLAGKISVETLAGLVELSPFYFSHVFRQATDVIAAVCHAPADHPRPATHP